MATTDPLPEPWDTVWLSEPLRRRESYEGRTALLPEVPLLGRLDLHQAVQSALPGHRHAGIIEVHFVRMGSLSMWVDSPEQVVTARGGQVLVTIPDRLHGGVGGLISRARFCWLQVRVPKRADRPLPGLSTSQTRLLLQPLAAPEAPPVFAHSSVTDACFDRLLAEHRRRRPDSTVMARSLLHELVALLGRDCRSSLAQPCTGEAVLSTPIQNAIRWLEADPGERMTVARMAKAAGMSERHFRDRFYRETGLTPSDFVARWLVERARELLRQSERTVTDIALELGFSTSAYFAAFFRRHTGQTPSDCRREARQCESR